MVFFSSDVGEAGRGREREMTRQSSAFSPAECETVCLERSRNQTVHSLGRQLSDGCHHHSRVPFSPSVGVEESKDRERRGDKLKLKTVIPLAFSRQKNQQSLLSSFHTLLFLYSWITLIAS